MKREIVDSRAGFHRVYDYDDHGNRVRYKGIDSVDLIPWGYNRMGGGSEYDCASPSVVIDGAFGRCWYDPDVSIDDAVNDYRALLRENCYSKK